MRFCGLHQTVINNAAPCDESAGVALSVVWGLGGILVRGHGTRIFVIQRERAKKREYFDNNLTNDSKKSLMSKMLIINKSGTELQTHQLVISKDIRRIGKPKKKIVTAGAIWTQLNSNFF